MESGFYQNTASWQLVLTMAKFYSYDFFYIYRQLKKLSVSCFNHILASLLTS